MPLNPASACRPRLAQPWARPYVVATVASRWLRCCLSPSDSSQGRNTLARGSDAVQGLADRSVDFGRLEGGHDETFHPPCCALSCSDSSGGQGCKNGRLDGCFLPITLPVAVGLGGNAEGHIKCPGSRTSVRRRAASPRSRPADSYEPVSVFDGHRSVKPQLIRTTLFPCSRPWLLSCFDEHICDRGASSRGPPYTHGCFRHVCRLGYPLLIPSTKGDNLNTLVPTIEIRPDATAKRYSRGT